MPARVKMRTRSRSKSRNGTKIKRDMRGAGSRGTRRAPPRKKSKAAALLEDLSTRLHAWVVFSLASWLAMIVWIQTQDSEGQKVWNAHFFIPLMALGGLQLFPIYYAKDSPLVGQNPLVLGVEPKNRVRAWSHPLVWTSWTYAAASMYAVHKKQYSVGSLLFVVSWGSTMFHKFRETKWFNLDNVYAQSLIGIGVMSVGNLLFSMVFNADRRDIAKAASLLLLVVITFGSLFGCGQPAIIRCCPDGSRERIENPKYPGLHCCWHITSSVLISLGIWFIAETNGSCGAWLLAGYEGFDEGLIVPLGSTVSLMVGFLANYALNYSKVGPWE